MNESQTNGILEVAGLFDFGKIFSLVLGFTILWAVVKVVTRFSGNLESRFPSRRLFFLQVTTVITFVLYIVGTTVLIYGVLKPPKELLFALGGSAAVAIGLSLKDLVASLVAGFILLFDRPFQVGDRVTFGDIYGEIKSIGLRAVRLVTLDDNIVTIPNSKFVTDSVASGNAGELDMMVCVDFHLAPNANLNLAKKIIFETVVTSRYVYLKKPVSIVLVEQALHQSIAVVVRAKAYVLDVKYEKAFQSDVVLRVENSLAESAIERPYLRN